MEKIIGRKPVLEALEADVPIIKLYISHTLKESGVSAIRDSAQKRGIKIAEVPASKIKDLEEGKNSQGVVAIRAQYRFYDLSELIEASRRSKDPLILILDSIQDPHNLGAILRTAEAAGVDGVITTIHNSAPINAAVEKASAGAVSHLKISIAKNLNQSLKYLKEEGFWIVGSKLGGRKTYTELDYKIPIALIVGNEEKGIRRLVAENCDFLIEIPMHGEIKSLNVSVAAGILLFEILRQRKD
jgi:23S rRNA (guanosine2251-2'-O)-methyltransferase